LGGVVRSDGSVRGACRRKWADERGPFDPQRCRLRQRGTRGPKSMAFPPRPARRAAAAGDGVRPVRLPHSRRAIRIAPARALTLAAASSPGQTRRAYFAWLAVCISWGTPYLATRVAIESIQPFAMAGTRHFVAGGLLALVLVARGVRFPS